MATRLYLRSSALTASALTASAATFFIMPTSTIYAEAPPEDDLVRKPIYDDFALLRQPRQSTPSPNASPNSLPTPTDRLAHHVGRIRLFVHAHSQAAEDRLNAFMSTILSHERSFTQTLTSLTPPPETHERVMPGALYVLVATMAGSIISRNRNILLRASVPFSVGLGAAWTVLPVTTRNVADLVWTYEERSPLIANNHMRVRGASIEGWRQVKARGEAMRQWSDGLVRESRKNVESWVRKE